MRARQWSGLWLVAAGVLAAGCGGDGSGGSGDGSGSGDAQTVVDPDKVLWPLAIGNEWVYRVSDPITNATYEKTTRVIEKRSVPGREEVEAYVLESASSLGSSLVYIEARDDSYVRHREDNYGGGGLIETKWLMPFSLRAPRVAPAAGWTLREKLTEETLAADGTLMKTRTWEYDWSLTSRAESLRVPAGEFVSVRFDRVKLANGKDKTIWWVGGVGKVREDDAGVIEELVRYTVQ